MSLDEIFEKLISHPEIRTKAKIAKICGVSPPALSSWKRVPDVHCIKLENACDACVTRYEMRPDVFGPEPNNGSDLTAA